MLNAEHNLAVLSFTFQQLEKRSSINDGVKTVPSYSSVFTSTRGCSWRSRSYLTCSSGPVSPTVVHPPAAGRTA